MKVLSFLLLCFPLISLGQIAVDDTAPYDSPQYLVEEVLLGSGVVATNISFSGNAAQIGFFNGTNSNLGLDSGVVMSSAAISTIVPGGIGTDDFFSNTNDADLISVAQSVTTNPWASSISSTHDLADLNFDFTVVGDTVQFEFVFGSDEYTAWINSQYNDVFSFFLSGPGITGPYASPAGFPGGSVNVALVPGTTDPITISSVQPDLNSQYYIDNPSNTTVGLNGFTTVITAKYPVICGETYHFRFAIADCQDGSLGSAVFLKAGSLTSDAVQVSLGGTITGNNSIVEGCTNADLWFIRPDTLEADTIYYSIGGNAQNGVDYELIADSVYFLPGQDSASVSIVPIQDAVFETNDSIYIEAYTISPCGDTLVTSETIYILDSLAIQILSTDHWDLCPGQPTDVFVEASEGIEPYNYSWYNIGTGVTLTGDTISVTPTTSDTLIVTVTDYCGFYQAIDTVIVSDSVAAPIVITLPNDTTFLCSDIFTVNPTITGGIEPYSYVWNNGSAVLDQQLTVVEDSVLEITVTDYCGVQEVNDVNVYYNYVPLEMNLILDVSNLKCPGDNASLHADVTAGILPYQYLWSNGDQNNVTSVDVTNDMTVSVTVTDKCGLTITETADIQVPIITPITISPIDSVFDCAGREISITPDYSGGLEPLTFSWSGVGGAYSSEEIYNFVLSENPDNVTFLIEDFCGNQESYTFPVTSEICQLVFPNIITPNGDGHNQYFVIQGLDNFPETKLVIYNRWGKKVFYSDDYQNDWKGTHYKSGSELDEGVYYYVAYDQDGGEYSGFVHVQR